MSGDVTRPRLLISVIICIHPGSGGRQWTSYTAQPLHPGHGRERERVRNQTNRSIMCNLSISISDGVCVLGTEASQLEFLESCEWIEQIHTRGLFQHLRGIYFSSVCYFVGFNCKSGSFHLWPNVLMIAIWPSSEKLELGFRWDLPACCA